MNMFSITDNLPGPSTETKIKVRVYATLAAAVLALLGGATLVLSGLVFIPLMAVSFNLAGIVGASAMVTVGAGLAGAAYIWLTAPA
jgi:hypothetical protein